MWKLFFFLKRVTFTPELISGSSAIISSFWGNFHFQTFQLCFGSCNVEKKTQIHLMLKENSQSPQLRGTTVNDSILILSMRNLIPIPSYRYSTQLMNVEYWVYHHAGNKTMGRSYFVWIRESRCGMSLPSPQKLFLLPSPTCSPLCKMESHVRNSNLLQAWQGRYGNRAAHLHILITINMYFFSFVLRCSPFIF